MREIRQRVTIHPETVERAETVVKELRAAERATRPPKEKDPEVKRRYMKRPEWCNSLVWNTAMSLAGGDYKRLDVLSSTEIRVENSR